MIFKTINNPSDISEGEKVIHNSRIRIFNTVTGIRIVTCIKPGRKELIYTLHGWDQQENKLSENCINVLFSDLARTYKIYIP